MVLFFAAALLAISAGSLAWYVLHMREVRTTVTQRLSNLPQSYTFPYTFETGADTTKSTSLRTLDESFENKTVRRLYLAGFRSKKASFYFVKLPILGACLASLVVIPSMMSGAPVTLPLLAEALALVIGIPYMGNIFVNGRRKKFEKAITHSLPQMLDLIIVSMEAGLNFTAALPRVMKELDPVDPLIKEFRLLNHE